MNALALRLAIRNLGRHRRRVAIVGLSVAVGVMAAVVQRSLVAGVRQRMIEHLVVSQFGHIAILPPARATPASSVDADALPLIREPAPIVDDIVRGIPGLRVAPTLSALGMAFGERSGTARIGIHGIVPEAEPRLLEELRRRLHATTAPLEAGSAYLGKALADRLELEGGATVTLSVAGATGDLDAMDFLIAEVLDHGAPWQDYFVYVRLEDLQVLMGVGEAVSMLKVYVADGPAEVDRVAATLRSRLLGAGRQVRVETFQNTGRLFLGIIAASQAQAGLIEIVLLAAMALAVAGAQALAVHERRREIGTMAALGTSRSLIKLTFLIEGAALAMLAGAIGAVLGAGVAIVLGRTGIGMDVEAFRWAVGGARLVPQLDPAGILWVLAELLLVVTLAGLYPAARAARLPPAEAMRRAGA